MALGPEYGTRARVCSMCDAVFQCAHFVAVHMSILFVPLRFDSHMQDMQTYICCSFMTILFSIPMRSLCGSHVHPAFSIPMRSLCGSIWEMVTSHLDSNRTHLTLRFNSLPKCKTCKNTCSHMTILYFVNMALGPEYGTRARVWH